LTRRSKESFFYLPHFRGVFIQTHRARHFAI
jgi:hypothetical protein